MKRFRQFIGKEIILDKVKNSNQLNVFGVTCTYLPDPPEEFDEFEFRTDFGGQNNIIITVATELGKIQRVIFAMTDEEDPEIARSLIEPQLEEFLAKKGEQLVKFFEYIT